MRIEESNLRLALKQVNGERHFNQLVDICDTVGRNYRISYNNALKVTIECIRRRLSSAEAVAVLKHYANQ